MVQQERKHFLVFVPGFMGSKLRNCKTKEIVWLDLSLPKMLGLIIDSSRVKALFATLAYYKGDELEPFEIFDQLLFLLPWVKQEGYNRLIKFLKGAGYEVDPEPEKLSGKPALYTFPYDWRQDNRLSAQQLKEKIDGWRVANPDAEVWIIAHSNGGLVARWYIEREGGAQHVKRLFLLASPWDGAPNAMQILFGGFDKFLRGIFNYRLNIPEVTREAIRTFPSIYQLLPHSKPFLWYLENREEVDIFTGHGWLDNPGQRELLEDGKRFSEELGNASSVPETICFFGRSKKTNTFGDVDNYQAGGQWKSIKWYEVESGDGTVLNGSARHPSADMTLPYTADHGNIYAYPPLQVQLEYELIGKFKPATLATLATENLVIIFEPEKDLYGPGEPIHVWATVHGVDGSAISNASVEAFVEWIEPLPGMEVSESPQRSSPVRIRRSDKQPGKYEGILGAPQVEGYYRIKVDIDVQGEPAFELEEIIAVENLSGETEVMTED